MARHDFRRNRVKLNSTGKDEDSWEGVMREGNWAIGRFSKAGGGWVNRRSRTFNKRNIQNPKRLSRLRRCSGVTKRGGEGTERGEGSGKGGGKSCCLMVAGA